MLLDALCEMGSASEEISAEGGWAIAMGAVEGSFKAYCLAEEKDALDEDEEDLEPSRRGEEEGEAPVGFLEETVAEGEPLVESVDKTAESVVTACGRREVAAIVSTGVVMVDDEEDAFKLRSELGVGSTCGV